MEIKVSFAENNILSKTLIIPRNKLKPLFNTVVNYSPMSDSKDAWD